MHSHAGAWERSKKHNLSTKTLINAVMLIWQSISVTSSARNFLGSDGLTKIALKTNGTLEHPGMHSHAEAWERSKPV